MKANLIASLLVFPVILPAFLVAELNTALHFLGSQKKIIQEESAAWASPPEEVLAIISPELIRHHLLRDFFETQALELAYVRFGKGTADFSIGHFQMKPSFIEKLEYHLSQDPDFQQEFHPLLTFTSEKPKAQRKERLARLQDFRWQLQYAYAFYRLGLHRFAILKTAPARERIAFLAAAYNFGFDEPEADICQWQTTVAFPYGKKYRGAQSSYAELALAFYGELREWRTVDGRGGTANGKRQTVIRDRR